MQTQLSPEFANTPLGRIADAELRRCVHCGFCSATCPTYQLTGDELDSPRGRIYQVKLLLEGQPPNRSTQLHFDRCLTCLNCETTCPSGVSYRRIIDTGRELTANTQGRTFRERVLRNVLRNVFPYSRRFAALLKIGRMFKPFLPAKLKRSIPSAQEKFPGEVVSGHARKVIMLAGCVQPVLSPRTNQAARLVLDRLGIEALEATGAGCCGSLDHHYGDEKTALNRMRRNIDAWWPLVEQGAEALLMTASGCGLAVKDYRHLLGNDPEYAPKAAKISEITQDISGFLAKQDLSGWSRGDALDIAYHPPCTLQHGQPGDDQVASILSMAGYRLTPVADQHLCCGSAGAYSLLNPDFANQFKENKLASLESGKPTLIATANIGCQTHLATGAGVPVVHWIELLAELDPTV